MIEKLRKVSDSFTVNMYENGFMVEISGRNGEEDYVTSKIICLTLDDLNELIATIVTVPRDN